jgi:hypothetical protein
MFRLFSLFTILAVATAFTAQPWGVSTTMKSAGRTQTASFMFSAKDADVVKSKPSPLTEVSASTEVEAPEAAPVKKGSTVRNMNTGESQEVQWTDPAMAANTNPFLMSWWAYVFFAFFPATLLLNDAFHFLPKDGVIGFLGRM